MPMYNLLECSDNYSYSSGGCGGFKKDERANNEKVTNDDNAPLFKYKANLTANTSVDGTKKECKNSCTTKIFKYFLEIIRNAIY